jgi:hypothetical protein
LYVQNFPLNVFPILTVAFYISSKQANQTFNWS